MRRDSGVTENLSKDLFGAAAGDLMSLPILVIDDSAVIHAIVRGRLEKDQFLVHSEMDGESGLAAARNLRPRLILLDVEMPGQDGFATCARLKADRETSDIPVIFLTGSATTDDKIQGLELGAVDYITKPFDPAELMARVRSALRSHEQIAQLARQAQIDGLTGLWNRAYLDARLGAEVLAARRSGQPLSCIMADLDEFKAINDQFGHPCGDEVLRQVAKILSAGGRPRDSVCRFGGEEFALLLPDTPLWAAERLAEMLRHEIERHSFEFRGRPIRVTCSFGVSVLPHYSPPSIVELADDALYGAKHSGRNRVECSAETDLAKA